MSFGTPGPDTQTQVMLQVMLNLTIFGMELQEAVEAPRFASLSFPSSASPHAYIPGRLLVEPGLHEHVADALARLGHRAECWPDSGSDYFMNANAACAVLSDRTTGVIKGAADPRRPASPLGGSSEHRHVRDRGGIIESSDARTANLAVIPAKGDAIQLPPGGFGFGNGHLSRKVPAAGPQTRPETARGAITRPRLLAPKSGKRGTGIGLRPRKRGPSRAGSPLSR